MNKSIKIKNFIFDMGDVLLKFSPDRIIKAYTSDEALYEKILLNVFKSSLWVELDRGTVTENDIFEQVSINFNQKEISVLKNVLDNWHLFKTEISGAYEFILKLKEQSYGIYLLSNVGQRFYDFKDKFRVFNLFDSCFISSDYKLIKPDKDIYIKMLEINNLNPKESVFIDDRLINVKAASDCGINAILFNGNYASLIQNLKNKGLLDEKF